MNSGAAEQIDYIFKLVIFGDGGVGKTSLTQQYLTGVFSIATKVTIGVEFFTKTLVVLGKRIKLQIWDFGGEERFRFLLPQYCKRASGAIFAYDITSLQTLQHLPDWLQVINEYAPNIPILVVGTKADLIESRKVTEAEAVKLAKQYKTSGFAEVSAKTGMKVNHVFEAIARLMFLRTEKTPSPLSPQ